MGLDLEVGLLSSVLGGKARFGFATTDLLCKEVESKVPFSLECMKGVARSTWSWSFTVLK